VCVDGESSKVRLNVTLSPTIAVHSHLGKLHMRFVKSRIDSGLTRITEVAASLCILFFYLGDSGACDDGGRRSWQSSKMIQLSIQEEKPDVKGEWVRNFSTCQEPNAPSIRGYLLHLTLTLIGFHSFLNRHFARRSPNSQKPTRWELRV